jgi:hypothetical protein
MFLEVSKRKRELRKRNHSEKSNQHCDPARSRSHSAHDKQTSGENAVLIATDKCDTEGRR